MNRNKIDRVINLLYLLSAIAILLGAFLKLLHYPFGSQLVWGGFISGFLFSGFEINRLKKIIKNLEQRKFVE